MAQLLDILQLNINPSIQKVNILKKKNNNEKKIIRNFKKRTNSLSKLSLFQKNDGKFSKKCPLSVKKCT